MKKIQSALISVFYKDKLDLIVKKLDELGVKIYSTGGTKSFIEEQGVSAVAVEDVTGYPSIFGGRVKTLHPAVFGGILFRRENEGDLAQADEFKIPAIDLVIVDLYPFEETVKSTDDESQIIEKIDIGGISLIRAAAKNYKDVTIVSSRDQYDDLLNLLEEKNGETSLEDRKMFAREAFNTSSHYDSAIYNFFDGNQTTSFKQSITKQNPLRYGENPHQKGAFYGDISEAFDQLHGKEISYNNLGDIDAAVNLIAEFDDTAFAILKHCNACGVASRPTVFEAWKDALSCDPVSAFGGVFITNTEIDKDTAEDMDKIFFEVVIAPSYTAEALEILKKKKNRIILVQKDTDLIGKSQFRSILNGVIVQDKDLATETVENFKVVTEVSPSDKENSDLVFANKIVKHTKSNAIVLAKDGLLMASGVGQTSRVDALKQAIEKAKSFGFDLNGAVMASDAFFPFADCVEIARKEGVTSVVQPGGSIRDKDSIDFCNKNGMSMVVTGTRHFKH